MTSERIIGAIDQFLFTAAGDAERELVVHSGQFHRFDWRIAEHGRSELVIHVEAARPGHTLDDRGEPDWVSPVLVSLSTDPVLLPQAEGARAVFTNAITEQTPHDGFLFFWDHSPFEQASLTVERYAAAWRVSFDGGSTAGHRVVIKGTIPESR